MSLEKMSSTQQIAPSGQQVQTGTIDIKERLLVVSLELSRRALETGSFDELCFLVTNDVRALIPFDRSFLLTHLGGTSEFMAAGNQPVLDKKSKFHDELNRLAVSLHGLERPVLLSGRADIEKVPDDVLSPDLKEALSSYMEFSNCKSILCVPLRLHNETVGHLLLEYLEPKIPEEINVMALLKLAPFLAAALAQKWMVDQHPDLAHLTQISSWRNRLGRSVLSRYAPALIAATVVLVLLFFLMPVPHQVGGEAEIVPRDRHVAFAKMDGLIDRILVTEGSAVKEGQVLAALDPTDLNFKTDSAEHQFELLTKEMTLLQKSGGQDLSKLADSQLVELKRKSVMGELRYLKWQRQFLTIKAPASGIIVTKQIETLSGKKFKAGEPFCEIAVPGELWAEIYVPEDKIRPVKLGQEAELYLNSDPRKGYPLSVKEVAPRADVLQRLGNVYRVRADFTGSAQTLKVGMKGVGKIETETTNLYSIVAQRLTARWNQFALFFL
jgi:multidrug resistance efflux pump